MELSSPGSRLLCVVVATAVLFSPLAWPGVARADKLDKVREETKHKSDSGSDHSKRGHDERHHDSSSDVDDTGFVFARLMLAVVTSPWVWM